MMKRHKWADSHELMRDYYDNEWQIESHDDRYLFEMLILEGQQAGLSWLTILRKRQAYKEAFDNFDYLKIAEYDEADVERLMQNEGIIRHRLKINSIINNAQQFIKVQQAFGSFDQYIWSFTEGKPIITYYDDEKEIPTMNSLSEKISKDLKKRGFKFVGPVIIYSYLGAIGLVQDWLK